MTGSWLSPARPRAALLEVADVRGLTARINLYNSLQPANAEPVVIDAINVDPWGGPAHVRLTGAEADLARWLTDVPGAWVR